MNDQCPECAKTAFGPVINGKCGWCWQEYWQRGNRALRRQLAAKEKENVRLRAIVSVNDTYFKMMQVAALKGLRGPPTDAERSAQTHAWQACIDARNAAKAIEG